MIKTVIKVAVRCPKTPKIIAKDMMIKNGRINFNKAIIVLHLSFIFNNPF